VDERKLLELMNDLRFQEFLEFLLNDLSGLYKVNSQASPFFEGRRSIGLEVRSLISKLSQNYKKDYSKFGVFYKG
jgi:hypothetical protein